MMKRLLLNSVTTKLIFTSLFFIVLYSAKAQNNLKLNAGLDMVGLFNLGLDYELRQLSFGASAGYSKENEDNDFALSVSMYYYFGGESKYAEKNTWFARINASELIVHGDGFSNYLLYLSPRIGRDFYWSEHSGIKADVGINYLLHEKNKTDDFTIVDDAAKFLPAFSLGFFYRF